VLFFSNRLPISGGQLHQKSPDSWYLPFNVNLLWLIYGYILHILAILKKKNQLTKINHIVIDNITIRPLNPQLWTDFEQVFGPGGAYGWCWCMWWRSTRKAFSERQGDGNRAAMKSLVDGGRRTGLLAYQNGLPCGWCSISPREEFESLGRSRVLKPVDDQKVWSLVCFYIPLQFRKRHLSEILVKGAIEYVKLQGGTIIEAYPAVMKKDRLPPVSSFMGIPSVLEEIGFKVIDYPSPSRLIMRYSILN